LDDGSFSEVSNPINVGLNASDSNPTRFHNIDDHLKIGGKSNSDLVDLSFEEKCELLSDLKSRRTSEGYDDGQDYTYNHYSSGGGNTFYPGFNVTGITTTTTWPWNTLQRGQNVINYPEECPEHDYNNPNGDTVEQACGTNILWSMKAYDINDVASRAWRGNTFGSKYLEMEFEYKTPSNPASVESEYEWNATNELTYSRIENNYAVEEAVVENSDSVIQSILDV
jgi:hypothetical protein